MCSIITTIFNGQDEGQGKAAKWKRWYFHLDGGILFLLHFSTFQIFHFHSFMLFCMFKSFLMNDFFLCWMVCIHVFLTSSLKYNSHRNSYFPKHTMHPALRHRTDTGSSEAPSCSFPDTAPPKGNHFPDF